MTGSADSIASVRPIETLVKSANEELIRSGHEGSFAWHPQQIQLRVIENAGHFWTDGHVSGMANAVREFVCGCAS